MATLKVCWQQRWETAWREIALEGKGGWYGPLTRAILRLASWPYGWAIEARNRLYDRHWLKIHTAAVPVISIGNLHLGGTGKTPCIEYVARYFRQWDIRVAILSRGYGTDSGRNDEAYVLEENLPDVPHLQNADRVAAAECAVQELDSQLLLLDDGFQHRRLHRDLDIVLINAARLPGDDLLFPRGSLREPFRSLRRADCVILTHTDQVDPSELCHWQLRLSDWATGKVVAHAVHEPVALRCGTQVRQPQELNGQPVAAFCGIGQPDNFKRTLKRLGAHVCDFRSYPDHHPYTKAEVETLHRWASKFPVDTWIVTTQKDQVKLQLNLLGDRPLWTLTVAFAVTQGKDAFHAVLDGIRATIPTVTSDREPQPAQVQENCQAQMQMVNARCN